MKIFNLLFFLLFPVVHVWAMPDTMLCKVGDTNYNRKNYANGNIKFEGCLCETGQLHGKTILYNRQGKVKEIHYYFKGKLIMYKTYFTRSNKLGQIKKVNGQKFKKKIRNCSPRYSRDYKDYDDSIFNKVDSLGNNIGIWKENFIGVIYRFDEGHYSSVGYYFFGKKYGTWYYYDFDTGCLIYTIEYQEGVRDGELTKYRRDGTRYVTYFFVNGVRTGEYIDYDRDGNVKYHGGKRCDLS